MLFSNHQNYFVFSDLLKRIVYEVKDVFFEDLDGVKAKDLVLYSLTDEKVGKETKLESLRLEKTTYKIGLKKSKKQKEFDRKEKAEEISNDRISCVVSKASREASKHPKGKSYSTIFTFKCNFTT